jgi:hypothetical protein
MIKQKGGKMARAKENLLGAWAFLIGVVLAVIVGFVQVINLQQGIWAGIFAAIGIIIGLLNITTTETKEFLLAGAVLVIVSNFSKEVYTALPYVGNVINALVILFAPATIVVALKVVFDTARS